MCSCGSSRIYKTTEVLRWQTLVWEGSSQWYVKSAYQNQIGLLEKDQSLSAAEGRLSSSKTGGGGMIIPVTPVPCWEHFFVIVGPQDFTWRVWLVLRTLKAWWHPTLQLVSEHMGAISYWIPQVIFEEHIEQETEFSLIGHSPGLVLTLSGRSNNSEISQMLLEMEIRTNLWK